MTLEIFWLLGLVVIGLTFSILARSIPIQTTKDRGVRNTVVGWGVAIAVLWIFYGRIIVTLSLANKE